MQAFLIEQRNPWSRLSRLPADMAEFYFVRRYLVLRAVSRTCVVSSELTLSRDENVLDYDFEDNYLVLLSAATLKRNNCQIVIIDMLSERIVATHSVLLDSDYYKCTPNKNGATPMIFLRQGQIRLSYIKYNSGRTSLVFNLDGQPGSDNSLPSSDEWSLPKRRHYTVAQT